MVGNRLGSVCPPEESADAGAVAAARFDRPSGLPPEPFDELLPGSIGRTAADVSGHPNQLDSAQFRRVPWWRNASGRRSRRARRHASTARTNRRTQFQADVLGSPVAVPANPQMTATGAAYAAGLQPDSG